MAYSIVKVTPTLDTVSSYSLGDVLFVNTEFGLPARTAKLVNGFVVDKEKQLVSEGLTFFFFRENVANLGTINATANISDANFMSNDFAGAVKIFNQAETSTLDNLHVHSMAPFGEDADGIATGRNLATVITASATPTTANSYPVYVTAVIDVLSGTPNFTATDALELVLHFEY
tara:strand:- start:111 stop:632 length:522 start_codon:yes stop_codon:yes gene_type:complete